MDFNADNLKQIYIDWVKKSDFINLNDTWVEIKTPFTDFTGSIISIFTRKINKKYIITDYGNTINELEMHNIQIIKNKKLYLDRTLSYHGCNIDNNNHIYVEFENIMDFPKYKHELIQTIINISDLFLTSHSNKECLFTFDVIEYFDLKGISYSSRPYTLKGTSGYDSTFDLNIGKVPLKNIPTLHTKIINKLNDNMIRAILLAHKDIHLDKDEKIAAIINDVDFKTSSKNISILVNNSIEIINWSQRENYFKKYVA